MRVVARVLHSAWQCPLERLTEPEAAATGSPVRRALSPAARFRSGFCQLVLPVLLCSGCDSTPTAPAGRRGSQPPTTSVAPLPPTQPVSAPATQPTSAAAEAPEYVTVVDRYKPAARATISVATERGNRLVIATRNVKRLRIDRNRVPLDPDRSIALELDGQGLEWLRWSKVSEFERSPNGDWKPVRP